MENLESVPVTGPVTPQERDYAINALSTTREALHASVAGLSAEQLTYKPDPDRWSITECLEHIVLVEKGIFGAVRSGMNGPAEPDKRAEIKVSDVDVIKGVRSRSFRIQAPTPFVPTGRFGDAAGALAAFDEQRAAVIDYAQTVTDDLRTHYFMHLVMGRLDDYQALLLMASHGERHRKQIEEVKDSPDYPSTRIPQ
jgi:uncharacterized damage-inducible protein DinB